MSETEIQAVESKVELTFPESFRSCYLTCDGGVAQNQQSALEILSLRDVLEYEVVLGSAAWIWGLVPFSQNSDSNPICVCCKPPLTGYVVLVLHDDAPRLKFRSLGSFFGAAIDYVKSDRFLDTFLLPSDFDGPDRTKQDRCIARELVQLVRTNDALNDDERTHSLRFACDLFANVDVDEIATLLDIGDEYVHKHVMKRLKGIPGERARSIATRFEKEFDKFVDECAQMLNSANLRASVHTEHGNHSIRVDPGCTWLNMEMFFAMRRRLDFENYFISRVRFLMGQK